MRGVIGGVHLHKKTDFKPKLFQNQSSKPKIKILITQSEDQEAKTRLDQRLKH